MPLALILPRGDQWYLSRKPLIRRDKGDTLSLLVQILLEPWAPCTPPLASLLLPRLSGLAATEPTLYFLHFFRFPPMSPPFPARRLQLFCGFLRFFASLPPSTILFSLPSSSSPFPSPLQSSLPSPFPSPFPSGVRLRVPTPVPVPVPVPALSPLLSPFPSCAPSFTSTPFPAPAPTPSPWPFTSPLPSPFPPPTPIPPPTPFAPSCPSDPVTPPVRCACTDAGPCECVCVCVCVFIKLHMTAQSGLVILVILCHSRWSSQGGINDTCYENLWSNATEGTHSLYLYKSYLCVCVYLLNCT